MKLRLAVYTWVALAIAPLYVGAAPARPSTSSISELSAADQAFLSARDAVRIGDRERLAHWKGKGAQLSDTVVRLVKQFGEPKPA